MLFKLRLAMVVVGVSLLAIGLGWLTGGELRRLFDENFNVPLFLPVGRGILVLSFSLFILSFLINFFSSNGGK